MSKKNAFLISGIIFIVAIIGFIFVKSITSKDIVNSGDIEIHISNIEEQEENNFNLSAKIVNNSSLSLEKNNIFIDNLAYKGKRTNILQGSSDNINSSQSIQKRNSKVDAIDVEVKGDFSQIPANDTVQIEIQFQLKEINNESILLVFRSDQIRDDNNATNTHYTTFAKEVHLDE